MPVTLYKIRPVRIAGLIAVVGLSCAATAVGAGQPKPKASLYSVTISQASASGTTITVRGRIRLTRAAAAARKRLRVLVTLTNAAHHSERRTLQPGSQLRYRTSWSTSLEGHLTVAVRVLVAGEQRGKRATRQLTVTRPQTTPAGGTPLVGTFKLDAGSTSGAPPTGSYFEMLQSNGSPLPNLSSPAANKVYTPLTPGTDGGLETYAYQGPPNPAFSGGSSGNALANRIILPVPFYLINFSVETSATDAQLGAPDPLPSIKVQGSTLNGEITAWDAQWNGQSFNQGTPKPDGSLPAPTTPVSGTYDVTTRKFKLEWKSLIVGGPFSGFTGFWHLEGTFVPQTSQSILPPLPVL
jgi:hypothetical protein